MSSVLLYGDTQRSPALRHELPIAVGDPFLFAEVGGQAYLLTSSLERDRMAAARPDAVLVDYDDLGFNELTASGLPSEQVRLELISRAAARMGVRQAIVDFDFPLGVAERLRADGIELLVDEQAVRLRRRVKSDAELAGIRRAQRAAEAGVGAAASLLRRCSATDGRLMLDGEPLLAERLRDEIRQACAPLAPASRELMVVSAWQGLSHDPGTGPLPAALPIQIDLWPQDEESGCFTDMTRTFVAAGDPPPEIERQAQVVHEVRARILETVRPGVMGRDLYAAACDIFERRGVRDTQDSLRRRRVSVRARAWRRISGARAAGARARSGPATTGRGCDRGRAGAMGYDAWRIPIRRLTPCHRRRLHHLDRLPVRDGAVAGLRPAPPALLRRERGSQVGRLS